MGITLCNEPNSHITVSYDVLSSTQATIFIVFAFICAVCEILFIIYTLRFFMSERKTFTRIHFLLFYLSFHLSLISAVLYVLGGSVICYSPTVYNAIANFSYMFQGIGVYAVTMELLDSLLYVSQIDGPALKCSPMWCIPFAIIYCVGFLFIFFLEMAKGVLHYFYAYNALCHFTMASSFFIISKYLYSELSVKYPSFVNQENQKLWIGVAYTIMILMIVRSGLAFLNFIDFTWYLKKNYLGLFTIYILSLETLIYILPSMTLTIFMKINMERNMSTKALGLIKQEIQTGGKRFSKPGENNLVQEMVNFENADDDWA